MIYDPEKVLRMNYKNGFLLTEDEFNLEQYYHIRMRQLHNRGLHTPGIVWGLEVKVKIGSIITVSKGMAIIKASNSSFASEEIGQELILTKDMEVDLNGYGYVNGDVVYIWLKLSMDKDGEGEIHHWENTKIEQGTIKPGDANRILGKVRISIVSGSTTVEVLHEDGLRVYAGAYGKLTLPVETETSVQGLPEPVIEGKIINSKKGVEVSGPLKATEFIGGSLDITEELSIQKNLSGDLGPILEIINNGDNIEGTAASIRFDVNGKKAYPWNRDAELQILNNGNCAVLYLSLNSDYVSRTINNKVLIINPSAEEHRVPLLFWNSLTVSPRTVYTPLDIHSAGKITFPNPDYAEFFESNNGQEIAVGTSVVLEEGKIRPAGQGEIPIGIISANSGIVGGLHFEWPRKYLKDEFGRTIFEEYQEEVMIPKTKNDSVENEGKEEVEVDENNRPILVGTGQFETKRRPKINPEYNETLQYIPRSERPEWHCVGLLGQIPLITGQPTAPSWVWIKDVSENVQLWLVK